MAAASYRNSRIWPGPRRLWCAAVLVIWPMAAGACAMSPRGPIAPLAPDEVVLADFVERANGYMNLRRGLLTPATNPPGVPQSVAAQRELAQLIRAARRNAGQGEIITPAIAQVLRSALNPEVRGLSSAGTRASIRDDAPPQFALNINDAYPEGASRSTVPPNVLHVLPHLPDGLEYRIVGNHLVLVDVGASLIVDYLVNVMCAQC